MVKGEGGEDGQIGVRANLKAKKYAEKERVESTAFDGNEGKDDGAGGFF